MKKVRLQIVSMAKVSLDSLTLPLFKGRHHVRINISGNSLLLENGFRLLLENGRALKLENSQK